MSREAFEFCESILPKVSRSFALTIPMLDDDLYRPVLITYLQDRLLDNFEDEIEDIELEKRKFLMDQVVELFNPDNKETGQISRMLKDWAHLMPDKGLQSLTYNSVLIREAFDDLQDEVKAASYKWLIEMNQGMQKYLSTDVETFEDLDEYCYYVAGTVGGFLTDVILILRDVGSDATLRLLNSFNDSGLFLQKVNLVRDIKEDIRERRKNFWPLKSIGLDEEALLNDENREISMDALDLMLENIKAHIPNLINYLDALPDSLPGYKRFFTVNNALGLATIEKMENNPRVFYGRRKVKVAKLEFLKILKSPEKVFYDKALSYQNV